MKPLPGENIRTWLIRYLTESGLWPDEAQAVVSSIEQDTTQTIREIMNKDASGYPSQVWAACILVVDSVAVKWIDANKPRHFARPMFTGELTQK